MSILAALLAPSLKKARDMARGIKCMSNLRQIGAAFIAYATDHNDQLPLALELEGGTWIYWFNRIETYVGVPIRTNTTFDRLSVWNCPANKYQTRSCGTGIGEDQTSYGVNGWYEPTNPPAGGPNDNLAMGGTLGAFASPAALYLVGDSTYFRYEPWSNDGMYTVPTMATGARYCRYVHSGRLNMCFADGHVESLASLLENVGTFLGGSGLKAGSFTNGSHWYRD